MGLQPKIAEVPSEWGFKVQGPPEAHYYGPVHGTWRPPGIVPVATAQAIPAAPVTKSRTEI